MSGLKPGTFCGMETPPSEASIVVFGAPFDGTTSFRPGTRFAAERMRLESWGLETYSPYLDADLDDVAVGDAGDLDLAPGDAARSIDAAEAMADRLLGEGRLPLMLGGEHSLSLGPLRAALRRFPRLHVVHFDAHTDLREELLGQPLSHACVIRRMADVLPAGRIHSFGIRSGLRDEWRFAREHLDFHPFGLDGLTETLAAIGDDPIYLTIDLDVLDPSVFPGTGTPEPGGVAYVDLQRAVHAFAGRRVIAADLMELSPPLDVSGASTAVACKILRELSLVLALNVSL